MTTRIVLEENAVLPSKVHETDTGYDVTLIRHIKYENGVDFYSTGIRVAPPEGFYFELVPRSSLSKLNYSLANSIGIIDFTYRGEIIVALRKMNDSVPDLELPCRCCQLILRKRYSTQFEVVQTLDDTVRGDGGFGSTN